MNTKTIKIYVKTIKSGKTTFNVASTILGKSYVKIKTTKASGLDFNKYEQGYYDLELNTLDLSVSTRKYEKKDGTEGTEKVLWIKQYFSIKEHERTAEEQEEIDKLFEELPF